jgi:hypothetical protein
MMAFGTEQFGKWFILVGLGLALIGGLFVVLGKLGVFRLPGDIEFGGENWKIYFPLASCVIISIMLTFIMWLVSYLRK